MNKIMKISKKYNLPIIEDCAHAIESKYNNKHVGTFGTFGCFSFYATKNLSIGEGGMLLTNSKKLYERARILSLHGMDKAAWNRYGKSGYRHYDVSEIGYKYNLMDLLSAIGIVQLKRLNQNLKKEKKFGTITIIVLILLCLKCQKLWNKNKSKHSYHLFNLYLDKKIHGISRDETILKLQKKIGIGIHYRAIPDHTIYKNYLNGKLMIFQMRKIGRQTISLPLSPSLSTSEVLKVVNSVKKLIK